MSKRILCLIDTLGIGGSERQMVGLSVLLKSKGYHVDLAYYYNENFYAPLAIAGGVDPSLIVVGNSQLSKIKAIKKFIKNQGGYDWIIAYKGGPNVIGCILKLMGLKFKLIVSERIASPSLSRSVRKRFFFYRLSDVVVPNSFSQRDFICSHYPHLKNKTVVITNFTDTNHFLPSDNNKPDIVVLTAARIARQKNTLNYLEAVALMKKQCSKNVKFLWYGDVQKGEEDYAEIVKNRVIELGLTDTFVFHPNVANICECYQSCSFFCLPSNFEGFPNAICEAMSCGKPILCSRVCDNPNIVRDGDNGLFFDPSDVNDIANKLISMINMEPGTLTEMGKRSREIALEMFSEEAFVNKYIEILDR